MVAAVAGRRGRRVGRAVVAGEPTPGGEAVRPVEVDDDQAGGRAGRDTNVRVGPAAPPAVDPVGVRGRLVEPGLRARVFPGVRAVRPSRARAPAGGGVVKGEHRPPMGGVAGGRFGDGPRCGHVRLLPAGSRSRVRVWSSVWSAVAVRAAAWSRSRSARTSSWLVAARPVWSRAALEGLPSAPLASCPSPSPLPSPPPPPSSWGC